MKTKYVTYAEASEAAQRLGLKTNKDYRKGYKQDPKLPAAPQQFYAEDWTDWYDFFGAERPGEIYATYAEASEAAQRLGFKRSTEYNQSYKRDPKLPSNPYQVYAEDWADWYDFFGTERPGEMYATYAEASKAAQRLGLKTNKDYGKGYKQDPKLPAAPQQVYAEDWIDWYDFFGTKRPGEMYATYDEASKAVQHLGFKLSSEYRKGYGQDPKLPAHPQLQYAEDWTDWYDFLGTERPAEVYATYAEASEAAQCLGLRTIKEYREGYDQDPKLPIDPWRSYAEDWEDWYHFFGTERPAEKYATYAEASAAAQRLGFKLSTEYNQGYKRDPKLPSKPHRVYAEEWADWYGFLGVVGPGEKYATCAEASKAAQRLGLKSSTQYNKSYHQDPKLPAHPKNAYSGDWTDWFDFLGTERPIEKYATYSEASQSAQRLGFKGLAEYNQGYKQDPKLPAKPYQVYAEEWTDWHAFLGFLGPGEKYASHAEASEAAQRLGLKSSIDYNEGYGQDPKLPASPSQVYPDWIDWFYFLGRERPVAKYATYAEASEAAQRLGFKTNKEYGKGYDQDPNLPASPYSVYAEDWVSWPRFLGDESASAGELLIEYPKFLESIQSYVEAGTNQANKYSHLKAFLKDYVSELGLVDDPGAILARDIPFNERVYEAFVHATGDTQKKSRHNICSKFFDWVLEIYCSDEDDEGELLVLPGYRNPLRTVLKGLLDQLPSWRRSESNKPPLPMDAIMRSKQHLIPPEAKSFRELYHLHSFLEDSWFEVDPQLIDRNDPNCIYRLVSKDRKRDGERYFEDVYELWSPVKIVAN
ncbi:MAG TPA: hypothetical protein DCX68_13975 [Marinobacter hydrocarbonoclasticus]|uniref:VPA1269 family protein n=1 Tax=unclassified Marinobacter TaxID=83889 RepID=UPI000C48A51C|nr:MULTISPECIES: VPA1269 family protein [unclassified Marinobacter]MAC22837.1 hypothetical protein [Marinobacter sp.]MBH91513.1 hypothetical protein [Marinobacter sp.]HAX11138.1 hypothetical protein [Marinobacter nauticus]HCR47614.1 hypothetical protein [Marinobacter nauticus]|tara:strand:+ start:4748 stop:7180 length:2433 start_codon:yes stop_codon:yes gene_type:complete